MGTRFKGHVSLFWRASKGRCMRTFLESWKVGFWRLSWLDNWHLSPPWIRCLDPHLKVIVSKLYFGLFKRIETLIILCRRLIINVRACVRACVPACVRACLRACVPAYVRVCVPPINSGFIWQCTVTANMHLTSSFRVIPVWKLPS